MTAPRSGQPSIPVDAGRSEASREDSLTRQVRLTGPDRDTLRAIPTASGGDDVREDPPFPRPVATTGRRH